MNWKMAGKIIVTSVLTFYSSLENLSRSVPKG